jgi:exosome complex exonuclease DIS3/RRP44
MVDIDEQSFTNALIKALENDSVITKLKATHSNLLDEIVSLQNTISGQTSVIDKLKNELNSSKVEINSLKTCIGSMENEVDSLEQYSRRNSIRITGLVESTEPPEDIYEVVLGFFKDDNGLNCNVDINDIDRAHRVGQKKQQNRPVLVKFASYQTKQLILKSRRNLRENNDYENVYINEDLTKLRSELLYKTRRLKNQGKISECWSFDGKILIKTLDGKIKPVQSSLILEKMFPRSISQNPFSIPDSHTANGSAVLSSHQTTPPASSSPASSNNVPQYLPVSVQHTHSTKILNNGKVICFLSEEAPLSNWYPSHMDIDNIGYCHIEQFLFSVKAKAAGNIPVLNKIMNSRDASEIKKMGDKLKVDMDAFDEVNTVKRGIDAKFEQNPHLKQYLIDTYPAELCEASSNKFWGIGVYIKSRELYNFDKWSGNKLGRNTLGQLLMEKRAKLM